MQSVSRKKEGKAVASLDMNGPYDLDADVIDEEITVKSPGNYALGYSEDSTFYVNYVGRSDDNIRNRLKKWIGKYDEFKYSYATSPKAAFEKECQNFHDFGGTESLDNKNHPQRPDNTHWKCPVCDIYD